MENNRMKYPGEKGKADEVESLHVCINIYNKNKDFLDGCVLELIGNKFAESSPRGEYIIVARVMEI